MKTTILFLTAFIVPSLLFCQEKMQTDKRYELGLDASFINRFLPFDEVIGQANDYLLSYRVIKPNGKFSRTGYNLDFAFDSQKDDNERDRLTSRFGLDFRGGGGKVKNIHKKINVFLGFDLTLGYAYNAVKIGESGSVANDSNRNLTNSFDAGVGPFIGIQYNFTSKFGIYTEADFYANFNYQVSKFKTERLSTLDQRTEKVTFSDKISLPTSLVLFYQFK